MSYLARLVSQSGLEIRTGMSPAPPPADIAGPGAPEGGTEIEEVAVLRVAVPLPEPEAEKATPRRGAVSEPPARPASPEGFEEVERARDGREHPAQSPEPFERAVPETDAPGDPEVAHDVREPGPASREEADAARIRTLRHVVEWVAPNDLGASDAVREHHETERRLPSRAPMPRPGKEEPRRTAAPETRDEAHRLREPADTEPGDRGETRMRPAPAPDDEPPSRTIGERSAPPARADVVEERVEISIGAINVTVEAPERRSGPVAMPAPAPAAERAAPARPTRTDPGLAGRLRRRYVRI